MNNFYKAASLLSKRGSLNSKKLAGPLKGTEKRKNIISEKIALTTSGHFESYTQYLANLIYHLQLDKLIRCDTENYIDVSIKENPKGNRPNILPSTYIRNKCSETLLSIALPFLLFASINLLGITKVIGQQRHDIQNVSLKVGDTIPEVLWNMKLTANSQGVAKSFRLKDYQGKLILLDFWATWCASCINGFPKMEELQKAYGDDLKIILVNAKQSNDSYARIQKVLGHYRNKYGYEVSLDYLLADSILQQYFPHKILPHLIWIDKNGVLRAASYGKAANMFNVGQALEGDFSRIHQKRDFVFDKENFLVSELTVDQMLSRRVLTPYIEGLGIKSETIFKHEGRNYYQIWNKPLASLYFAAFADELRRISADRYQFDQDVDSIWIQSFLASANVNNKYCYETLLPDGGGEKEGRYQLSQDLLAYFGYKPVRKTVTTKVMLFSESTKLSSLQSKGGIPRAQLDPYEGVMYLQNSSLRSLYSFIATRLQTPYELVIESGYRIDHTLPNSFADYSPDQMIQYLSSLGVEVELVTKKVDIVQFVKI